MKHGLSLYIIYTVKQNSNLQIPKLKRKVKTLKKLLQQKQNYDNKRR